MPMVPLFPLPMVAFPDETVSLHIFEPRYRDMLKVCLAEKRPFCVVCAENATISRVGTLLFVDEVTKAYEDGRSDIRCTGLGRVEVLRVIQKQSYYEAEVIPFDDTEPLPEPDPELTGRVRALYRDLMEMASREAGHEAPPAPDTSFGFAQYVGFDLQKKQEILELRSEQLRLSAISRHLEEVVPRIKAYEAVKSRIIANGHFRQYPPINLDL